MEMTISVVVAATDEGVGTALTVEVLVLRASWSSSWWGGFAMVFRMLEGETEQNAPGIPPGYVLQPHSNLKKKF